MLAAIDFDDNARTERREVDNVSTDRRLASEVKAERL